MLKNENVNDNRIYYREQIIEMVNKMENLDFLFKIYHYILPKYKKEEPGI